MRSAPLLLAAFLGSLVACKGSAPIGPDATVFCARTIYDPCETEHDCADTACRTVSSGLQICTMGGCTPGDATSCPMQDGSPVTCGSDSLCTPPAATACHLNVN